MKEIRLTPRSRHASSQVRIGDRVVNTNAIKTHGGRRFLGASQKIRLQI
jgi:hypothetical protein